jgi:hypothetical protein
LREMSLVRKGATDGAMGRRSFMQHRRPSAAVLSSTLHRWALAGVIVASTAGCGPEMHLVNPDAALDVGANRHVRGARLVDRTRRACAMVPFSRRAEREIWAGHRHRVEGKEVVSRLEAGRRSPSIRVLFVRLCGDPRDAGFTGATHCLRRPRCAGECHASLWSQHNEAGHSANCRGGYRLRGEADSMTRALGCAAHEPVVVTSCAGAQGIDGRSSWTTNDQGGLDGSDLLSCRRFRRVGTHRRINQGRLVDVPMPPSQGWQCIRPSRSGRRSASWRVPMVQRRWFDPRPDHGRLQSSGSGPAAHGSNAHLTSESRR